MCANMIRLAPATLPRPLYGHVPYQRARRWRSPHEVRLYGSNLAVFVTQAAFVRACAHAGSDMDNEVGGWLVGKQCFDPEFNQDFIVVEKIIPAPFARHGSVYLTFTQDSQVSMHAFLEENYPGKEVVGWYHTHPKMGIFLSEYDTWLHRNFFPKPFQVAMVIEPHRSIGGFFIPGLDGVLDAQRYHGFFELTNNCMPSVVHWQNMLDFRTGPENGGLSK